MRIKQVRNSLLSGGGFPLSATLYPSPGDLQGTAAVKSDELPSSVSTPAPSSVDSPDGSSFVTQMRPALVKYFERKIGTTAEAEDLAQEVIVRALTHVDCKSEVQSRGYIFRIAVNLWRDRRRRLRVQGVSVEWDENTAAETGAENSPERVLIDREELNRVIQALRELDPRARTVLMLVKMEQMKIASVAQTLGVSVRTVAKDLARALARLARSRCTGEFEP